MRNLKKVCIIIGILTCFICKIHSQETININDPGRSTGSYTTKSLKSSPNSGFKDAERYREFSFNPRLKLLSAQNEGDVLLLDFFDDKKYKAVIKAITQREGITGITAEIADTKFGYCFISISSSGVSITADIPEHDEQYFVAGVNGRSYLSECKMSVMQQQDAGCETLHTPAGSDDPHPVEAHADTREAEGDTCPPAGENTNVIIDVMFVYTAAARQWCIESSQVTDIDHAIDLAMQRANLTASNSKIGLIFNMVHKYQTSYVEVNNGDDLSRMVNSNDGHMDEIHPLRKQYDADLIVLLPKVDFTGGIAYLLSSESGNKTYCSFSLSRIQQTHNTYTTVHEMGHNMGCSHHKDQNYQAGPGLHSYSSGWRGIDNTNTRIASVMTYESGSYFADKQYHGRIPYFSNPDVIYNGVKVGDAATANNALTIRKTKQATSKYQNNTLVINVASYEKNTGDPDPTFNHTLSGRLLVKDDEVVISRVPGETPGNYAITARVFREGVDVTCEYPHKINEGTLVIKQSALPAPGITITETPLEYDGTAKIPVITINPSTLVYTVSYEGALADGTAYPESVSAPSQAGVYTVTVNVAESATHAAATKTGNLVINKVTPVITLTPKVAIYTGSPVTIDAPVISGGTALSHCTFITEHEGINSTVYTRSETAPTDHGEYKVYVSTTGDNNHEVAAEETTLTIGKVQPVLTINDATYVYDTTPKTIDATVDVGVTITYTYKGTLSDGTLYPLTTTAPSAAGAYTVTATTTETAQYASVSASATMTIEKVSSNIIIDDQIIVYSGAPVVITVSVVPSDATLIIRYKGTGTTIYPETTQAPTEVGTYEVTVNVSATSNHNAVSKNILLTIKANSPPLTNEGGVTIGSGTPPAPGAMLQLKENDNLGVNSKQGFLLPRVNITNLNSLDDIATGLDKNAHIGLVVFNMHEDLGAVEPIRAGVYVWDGAKWRNLAIQ